MTPSTSDRKLAAILSADVVGRSRTSRSPYVYFQKTGGDAEESGEVPLAIATTALGDRDGGPCSC